MSLSIIHVTQRASRQYGKLLNISKYSTTGNVGRPDWGTYPRQPMDNNSIGKGSQHEYF